jgi:hypothetical protein
MAVRNLHDVIQAALKAAVREYYDPNQDVIWGGFERADFEDALDFLVEFREQLSMVEWEESDREGE